MNHCDVVVIPPELEARNVRPMSTAPATIPTLTATDTGIVELLKAAEQAGAEGRHDVAIAAIETALGGAKPDPSVSDAARAQLHAALANALMAAGRIANASENYKAALRLAPHLISCWCNLGVAYLQQDNADEAIGYFLQAVALDPVHWVSRTNLVKALIKTKQYLVAKQLLLELAEERPLDGQLQHDLGLVCYELQEIGQAIGYFNKACDLDPTNAEALYWIGGINQLLGSRTRKRHSWIIPITPSMRATCRRCGRSQRASDLTTSASTAAWTPLAISSCSR
jgi:tetratricopeptide (TPR) repeat protein